MPIGLAIGTDWLWRGTSKYNRITTTTGQAKTLFDNVLIAEEQEQFVDAKGVDRSHSAVAKRKRTKRQTMIYKAQHTKNKDWATRTS